MAFLTVNTENVKKEGGSGFISKSGIYNVTLKHAEVAKTQNGATQINYFFDKAMSYGNTVVGVNGQPTFGYQILESLATVLGLDALDDAEPTTVTFKSGTKELKCLPDLNDVQVKVWIQIKYRMWNNEIREDVVVKRFYRESDNAAGSELALINEGHEANIGERFNKDSAVASEIIYDGVTEDAVNSWKKAKANGGSAAPVTPTATTGGFPGNGAAGFPGV